MYSYRIAVRTKKFLIKLTGFGTKNGTVNKGKNIIAGIGEPEKWL